MKNSCLFIALFAILISGSIGTKGQTTEETPTDPMKLPYQDPAKDYPVATYYAVFGGPCADADNTTDGNPCPCTGICGFDTMLHISPSIFLAEAIPGAATEPMRKALKAKAKTQIPVKFHLSKKDPSVLVMSFKTKELAEKQNEQLKYFKGAKEYKFMATFSLEGYAFTKLGLPKGARITPNDPCKVDFDNKGVTYLYVKYSGSKTKFSKIKK